MKIPGVIIIIATPDQRKQKAARGTKYTEESKMRRERIIQEKTHMYIYFTFGGETNVKKKKKKTLTGPYFSKSCLDSIGIIPLSIRVRLSLSIFILVSFDASIGLSRMVNLSWNALFHSLIFPRVKKHTGEKFSKFRRYRPLFFFGFVLFFCFFFLHGF